MVMRAGSREAYRMALALPWEVIWGLLVITLWVWWFNQFKNYLYSYLEPWYISHFSPTYLKRLFFLHAMFLFLFLFLRLRLFSYLIHMCFVGFQKKKTMDLDSLLLVVFLIEFYKPKVIICGNKNLILLLKSPIWLYILS